MSLPSWMLEYDCLETCGFGCLLYTCFIGFFYVHLFRAIAHASYGKAL